MDKLTFITRIESIIANLANESQYDITSPRNNQVINLYKRNGVLMVTTPQIGWRALATGDSVVSKALELAGY